jgi:hypothetical protein
MTAKRKPSQRKSAVPKTEEGWGVAEFLKDDPVFQQIVEELLHPMDVGKEEKLHSDIGDCFDSLCGSVFESKDATELDKRWQEFLNLNIALATRQLLKNGIPKEKVGRFIVYGWACVDGQSGDVRFRFGPPLDGGKAVLMILVFRNAVWYPPAQVEAAVWRHPTIRAVVGKDEHLCWKEKVMQRLTWAASLPDQRASSQRLRQLSDAITNMLYIPSSPDTIEEGWLSTAVESERFWAILAHAVDFGIHQNARRLFMDGRLLGAAQQSALNEKVKWLSWFLIIEEAIREKFEETGKVLTPSQLRKLFGDDAAPSSDKVVLDFPDARFELHGVLTWGPFQKYAKLSGKIWSDHRTE